MRTIPYKQLLTGVLSLAGKRYETASREEIRMLIEFIYERTKEVWEMYPWPDLMIVEERAFADGIFYADLADVPTDGESVGSQTWTIPQGRTYYFPEYEEYYVVSDAAGFDTANYIGPHLNTDGYYPDGQPAQSSVLAKSTISRRLIPVSQDYYTFPEGGPTVSLRDIGNVINVFNVDPRQHCNPSALPFQLLEGDGLDLPCSTTNSVWVYYRQRPIYFTGEIWDEDVLYAVGDQVYHAPTGEFYSFATSVPTVGNAPSANQKLEYPAIFETFVKRSAFADWLRTQGAFSEANVQRASAEKHIQDQITKLAGFSQQMSRAVPRVRPRRMRNFH